MARVSKAAILALSGSMLCAAVALAQHPATSPAAAPDAAPDAALQARNQQIQARHSATPQSGQPLRIAAGHPATHQVAD